MQGVAATTVLPSDCGSVEKMAISHSICKLIKWNCYESRSTQSHLVVDVVVVNHGQDFQTETINSRNT